MSARNVAQLYTEFAAMTQPLDAPPVQVQEVRRAFYAGVHALLKTLEYEMELLDEDAGVAHLEALSVEVTAFFDLVKASRA